MSKKKNRTPHIRTTISVPIKLKKKMDEVVDYVNWSSVACCAFEKVLEEIDKKNQPMSHLYTKEKEVLDLKNIPLPIIHRDFTFTAKDVEKDKEYRMKQMQTYLMFGREYPLSETKFKIQHWVVGDKIANGHWMDSLYQGHAAILNTPEECIEVFNSEVFNSKEIRLQFGRFHRIVSVTETMQVIR